MGRVYVYSHDNIIFWLENDNNIHLTDHVWVVIIFNPENLFTD